MESFETPSSSAKASSTAKASSSVKAECNGFGACVHFSAHNFDTIGKQRSAGLLQCHKHSRVGSSSSSHGQYDGTQSSKRKQHRQQCPFR